MINIWGKVTCMFLSSWGQYSWKCQVIQSRQSSAEFLACSRSHWHITDTVLFDWKTNWLTHGKHRNVGRILKPVIFQGIILKSSLHRTRLTARYTTWQIKWNWLRCSLDSAFAVPRNAKCFLIAHIYLLCLETVALIELIYIVAGQLEMKI